MKNVFLLMFAYSIFYNSYLFLIFSIIHKPIIEKKIILPGDIRYWRGTKNPQNIQLWIIN